jgi:ribose transport system ATP-binding protein
MNFSAERDLSSRTINDLSVRTPTDTQICQYLSGGNQQKVVVGKWLATNPKILLLDEPTRGIDIGAKQEVYKLMEQLAANGVAILFVSSEMEEILPWSCTKAASPANCPASPSPKNPSCNWRLVDRIQIQPPRR